MVGIVKEINGQKKIIPLTSDTGTGAAVGTLISQYKKVPMSGYLYCDGSTFDENDYPALYMYLGTNVLPDYRECVMVGAEQNTTDTIATHDVYGEGEFKDDQYQKHTHYISDSVIKNRVGYNQASGSNAGIANVQVSGNLNNNRAWIADEGKYDSESRPGTTTHGKQKAVYVYIKATSGLAENQQENVLNDVKNYVDGSIDKMHPTIDVSKIVSGNILNVKALSETYGNGRYVYIAQGANGNISATVDIYTLNLKIGNETYWMIAVNTYPGASVTYGAYNGTIKGSPTFTFNNNYASICKCISKACSLL